MKKIAELIENYGKKEAMEKLRDPVFFINEIIGFTDQHGEPSKLTKYQEEWLRLVEEHNRLNLMAFRSSGKSETLLICYPIFKAFTTPKWQGIVVSNSLKQSVALLRRIREKILENEILRTSVPDSRDQSWSKTEIQLKNGSIIWSRPNSHNLVGEHVNWIGGDEIGYWKDMDVIEKVIPPMVLSKGGKVVFIGTPTSEVDAIHQLQKNGSYYSRVYPATAKDEETGQTLWQMRYPLVSMQKVKSEYDNLSWSREFLCKPLSSEDRIYPYELISQCFDNESAFYIAKLPKRAYFIGLDFALSAEAGSDYTVYTVVEKMDDVCRVVNMERYKGLSYQAQKARINSLWEVYKPIKIVTDEGSFGKSFTQDLQYMGMNVQGFKFTNESKQQLHTNLRNMFEQRTMLLSNDQNDSKTRTTMTLLLKELSSFGVILDPRTKTVKFEGLGEHDDMVTSLALAAWGARSPGQTSWQIARGTKRSNQSVFYMGVV